METHASSAQSGQNSRHISLDRALPVPAACHACRSKHQRCDGTLPICFRCKKGNRSCSYAPSRRGRSVAHLHPGKVKFSEVRTPASSNTIEGLDVHLNRQYLLLYHPQGRHFARTNILKQLCRHHCLDKKAEVPEFSRVYSQVWLVPTPRIVRG